MQPRKNNGPVTPWVQPAWFERSARGLPNLPKPVESVQDTPTKDPYADPKLNAYFISAILFFIGTPLLCLGFLLLCQFRLDIDVFNINKSTQNN